MAIFLVNTLLDSGDDGTFGATPDLATETNDGAGLSLREALALANSSAGPDEINFDNSLIGGTIYLTQGQLLIDSDVTIDGDVDNDGTPDLTINGNSGAGLSDATTRVLLVNSGTSILDGLTISGGNAAGGDMADYGGGIYVNKGANASIVNSAIIGNNAANSGGGIYNYGTLTVTNSIISGNYANSEGGGLANFLGTANIIDSVVSGNAAGRDGGGIYNDGTLFLTNSTVSGNIAGDDGGGIYNYENAIIVSSTISGNTASDSGGGLYSDGFATLIDTVVNENEAEYGGGIYNYDETLELINSTVSGNYAGENGGGIYNDGTAVLRGSIVSNNSAGYYGGGIYNSGNTSISNSSISGNYARYNGGGIYNYDRISIICSTISGNIAGNYGGGIYTDGTATLIDTLVDGNSAEYGGGIYNYDKITITASVISNNSAVQLGGGIYSDGTATLTNTVVSGNIAGINGGGIFNYDEIILTGSTITGNSANNYGGGIFNRNLATLTNTTVSNNDAAYGGGIYNDNSLALTNVTLSGNSATEFGGGLYNDGNATLTNTTASGNTAPNGGGLYNSFGTVTLVNAIILGNSGSLNAEAGGAASITNTGGISIVGGVDPADVFAAIDGATGGGLLADNGGQVQTIALLNDPGNPAIDAGNDSSAPATDARGLGRSDFPGAANNDTQISDLGAFELLGVQPEARSLIVTTADDIVDSLDNQTSLREAIAFANDTAANGGTGDADNDASSNDTITFDPSLGGSTIYLTQGNQLQLNSDVTIQGDLDNDGTPDITINANSGAGLSDAASRVLLINSGTSILDGLIITGGNATGGSTTGGVFNNFGGGIYINYGAAATISNSIISGNSADVNGGGIYNYYGTLTVLGTTISGNSAYRDGGGLYTNGVATLVTTTISGNNAGSEGGGIYNEGTLTLTNTTISSNSAGSNGGGLYTNGTASLTNTTISGNSAGSEGGGIYNGGLASLVNSIVLGNSATADAESGGSETISNTGGTSIVGGVDPASVFAEIDGVTGGGLLADNGGLVQTIALLSDPANPALDAGDDALAPDTDARGVARFDFPVANNNGGNITDLGSFEIAAPPNDAPVAVDDTASIDEDAGPLTISVLTNDSDAEGDAFSVTGNTAAANGTVTDNGDGTFDYTPDADFSGSDSFTYTISDATGSGTATVSITVNPLNDAPVAVNDTASVDEDGSVTVDVLANDSDVDGDALTLSLASGPANGTATIGAGGITYTPTADFNGSDSFTYTISDGNGGSDTATVSVTVNPVNDDPVAADDSVTATIDTARDYAAATLLANDSDADGDVLVITAVGGGVNGSASLNGTTVTFNPDAGFTGAASFTYTVSDGNGGTGTATVNVTVTEGNLPPVADAARSVTTLTNTALAFDIIASDPDGDALSYSAGAPANGAVSVAGGRVTYTPGAGFTGSDTFTVTIDDGNGGTATQEVTVTTQNLPPANQFVMFAADGFTGGAGGFGSVNGTDGFQQISVIDVAGSVALDPSFNRGGDIVQLAGNAAAWSITRSGSSALFSDGDTFVTVPIGEIGLAVQFDDGVRELIFDGSNFTIGGQIFAAGTLSPIDAAPDGTALPSGADPAAKAVLFIAADAQIAASGLIDIFGAAGNEEVSLISGNLKLDASFNRGGDTVRFDEVASDYLASQFGSSLQLTGSDTAALIPAGPGGATLSFGDGSDTRTLLLDTAIPAITIDGQVIGPDPVQLMAA